METLEQQLEFEKGKEYEIEMYPNTNIVNAKYLGCGYIGHGDVEIFGNEDSFILVRRCWLEQRNDGIISHIPISSFCIKEIPKDNIKRVEGLTKLLQDLEGL